MTFCLPRQAHGASREGVAVVAVAVAWVARVAVALLQA